LLSFLLTFSPDECQSKSFENMNTLLSAVVIVFYINILHYIKLKYKGGDLIRIYVHRVCITAVYAVKLLEQSS